MESVNIENTIKKVFYDVFPYLSSEEFDWKKEQSEYRGWDSFAHLQLISSIENEFNIRFTPEETTSITKAEDILLMIESKSKSGT